MLEIRIFAGLKDVFHEDVLTVDIPFPVSLSTLKNRLLEEFPGAKADISQALFAVNQVYAPLSTQINAGDEVALIPPVGGGSTFPACRISDEPLSVSDAFSQMENVYHGGTVLFCGTVREFTNQRRTLRLTYQAYHEMAVKQMRKIEEEIAAQFPEASLLQWHRIGELNPGDIAVICAASAPHRNDAFDAARQLIERLKKEVPIWKKEYYEDGEATWQANETPSNETS